VKRYTAFFQLFALALAVLLAGIGANGQWAISFEKEFILKNTDGTEKVDLEPSAVQTISEKLLLVADDKQPELLLVEITSGRIIKSLPLPAFTIRKPKWEAMAFDGEFFYLVGSHAVKLDDTVEKLTKKLVDRSHLIRFKLKNISDDAMAIQIDSVTELDVTDSLKKLSLYSSDPHLNKVKIEGLAVRTGSENKKELFFALREPHDFMHVLSAELPPEPAANEKLVLKAFFSFEAGKIGTVPFRLSSIEYAAAWNGFFLITSTEDDNNAFYGNVLWFLGNESLKGSPPYRSVKPQVVWLFDTRMKAEGLTFFPNSAAEKTRLVLAYDNDAEDTKIPGTIRMLELSNKPK
jgi:hypothetical protein